MCYLFIPKQIYHCRSSAGLTWHNGAIPSEEIWVKLGGDKGRGSFKRQYREFQLDEKDGYHFSF